MNTIGLMAAPPSHGCVSEAKERFKWGSWDGPCFAPVAGIDSLIELTEQMGHINIRERLSDEAEPGSSDCQIELTGTNGQSAKMAVHWEKDGRGNLLFELSADRPFGLVVRSSCNRIWLAHSSNNLRSVKCWRLNGKWLVVASLDVPSALRLLLIPELPWVAHAMSAD